VTRNGTWFEWHVPPQLPATRSLTAAVESAIAGWVGDASEATLAAVIASECFTNIVRHGWRGTADERIVCTLRRLAPGYVLEFIYPGAAFDWRSRHDLGERVLALGAGGLGLGMIESFADWTEVDHLGDRQALAIGRRRVNASRVSDGDPVGGEQLDRAA